MALLVEAATNLAKNPKPTTLTYFGVGGGATLGVLSYDESYSGETSLRQTFNANLQYVRWSTNSNDQWGGVTTGIAQLIDGRVRVKAPLGASLMTWLVVFYSDLTTGTGAQTNHTLSASSNWQILDTGSLSVDPAKTISRVDFRIYSTVATEQIIRIGGLDVRSNDTMDSFVVGDGQRSSWAGDANNSVSTRESYSMSPVVKKGAQTRYSVKFFVVNRQNVIIDDITSAVDPGSSISIDMLGEATKGTLSINMSRNDLVLPFHDLWVSPRLTIEHSDGSVEGGDGPEGMLGIYSVEPASEVYDSMRNTFRYQGYDLLWIMQQEAILPTGGITFENPAGIAYFTEAGNNFRNLLKLVIEDGGFRESDGMLFLPPSDATIPMAFSSEIGIPRLDFVTEICDAMAWRRPWATLQGQITTEPIRDLALAQPDFTFSSGPNSDVRWPFEIDPEPEDMANRVRVFGKRQGSLTVVNRVIMNLDESHPFSYPNLGRWIDAPQMDVPILSGEAEADALGQAELVKRGMLPYTARLKTRAMIRQLNEVYELNLTDSMGDYINNGTGKYWCIGWQMTLGAPWEMTHNLKRIIPIFDTGYDPIPATHVIPSNAYLVDELTTVKNKISELTRQYKKRDSQGGTTLTAQEKRKLRPWQNKRDQLQRRIAAGEFVWVPSGA